MSFCGAHDVSGLYDHGAVIRMSSLRRHSRVTDRRLWKIRAKRVLVATGASNAFGFANNDLPVFFFASAVRVM